MSWVVTFNVTAVIKIKDYNSIKGFPGCYDWSKSFCDILFLKINRTVLVSSRECWHVNWSNAFVGGSFINRTHDLSSCKKKSLQILDIAFEDMNVLGDLVGIIRPEFILILKMNNEYNSLCISAVWWLHRGDDKLLEAVDSHCL